MATGPIKGVRIPVKLPWKGATNGKDQFVSMKAPVAKFLKMDSASTSDLEYQVKINKKDEPNKKIPGTKEVTRRRRPGYKTRSVMIQFGDNKTGKKKRVSIGLGVGSRYSIQFPITSSTLISDVVKYFESGKGKGLSVVRVTDVTTGQGYALIDT